MTQDARPPRRNLKQVRTLLWVLVALAIAGAAALILLPQVRSGTSAQAGFGGPFTLVGGDGKPFSSASARRQALCDLLRLHPLRRRLPDDARRGWSSCATRRAASSALNIVFVTIDPGERRARRKSANMPTLFNAPIIGLTGSRRRSTR